MTLLLGLGEKVNMICDQHDRLYYLLAYIVKPILAVNVENFIFSVIRSRVLRKPEVRFQTCLMTLKLAQHYATNPILFGVPISFSF